MKDIKNLPNKSGIYLVINTANNTPYIGQSTNIYERFNKHHIYDYKNENNCCYDTKFYKALRKYGIENFQVSVLELCEKDELDKKEIAYIKQYDSYHHGYNSTEGGQNWSSNIHSLETEEKRKQTRELNNSLKSENHPRAKMTNEEVWNVRQRYIDGESIKQIYEDYKDRYNNELTFKRIVLGQTYINVGNIPSKNQIRYTNSKLTETQVKEIRKKYANGNITYKKLGLEYGVSEHVIYCVVKRKTYQHID